ncbi:PREDICTED: lysozyme P [Rhagoletis zephyria]|uniref:lysozyme P n=1 Tax=Rhagoletis zephyria TaxID=28612 RepID=UPI0008117BB9|nr:PREDICTED: lysozyme P [Rhagoletis zephyria]
MHFRNKIFVNCITIIVIFDSFFSETQARIYKKCILARKLYRLGMPLHELDDWMCLVEGESSFNTKAINPSNVDGSVDWGLFQINDRYWCKPSDGRPSIDSCRLPCRLLLSNDIRFSVACAKYIRRIQGFSAWVAWNNRCQGHKPSVKDCFVHSGPY